MLPCLFRVSLLLMLWGVPAAWAGSHYVSPSGSGTTCSTSTPCSLTTGISKAVAGDEVILKDGTYSQAVNSVRHGVSDTQRITIRAEHPCVGTTCFATVFQVWSFILHSWHTVRGIKFDGNLNSPQMQMGDWSIRPTGIIVENNYFLRSGMTGGQPFSSVGGSGSTNGIFRHNIMEQHRAESIYFGSNDATLGLITGWQMYGNTFRCFGDTPIDIKPTSRQNDFHHNIFEQSEAGPLDQLGCSIVYGPQNTFRDNIIRNTDCGTALLDGLTNDGGTSIRDNVFHTATLSTGPSPLNRALWIYKDINKPPTYDGPGGVTYGPTVITQNTFCGTPRNVCNRNNQSQCGAGVGWTNLSITNNNGLNWSGSGNINLTGAPQEDCDAEVDRIIQEMAELPGLQSNPPETPCN